VDADSISYKFTIEDESTWSSVVRRGSSDEKVARYLSMPARGIRLVQHLVGARLEEKKAAEKK